MQYEALLWGHLQMHPRDVDRLTIAEFDRWCAVADEMNDQARRG